MINNKYIKNSRFKEKDDMWPGIALSLKVKKILLDAKTDYQDLLVFESKSFWNVLVLDWVIQVTERDEAAYQEMLSHIPLFVHKKTKKVLIIVWWDGWILREVIKHESVEKAVLCEIDEWVIEASKKYFPELSTWFNSNKSEVVIWDWAKYIEKSNEKFDVIIVDSSDPIWPADSLFNENFYKKLNKSLKKWWVLAIQWESLFLHNDIAISLHKIMNGIFKNAEYSQVHMPTYPWWNIGLLVCSDKYDTTNPNRKPSKKLEKSLKYYSKDIHKASFVLPVSYQIN